jgi:hypothetical protein
VHALFGILTFSYAEVGKWLPCGRRTEWRCKYIVCYYFCVTFLIVLSLEYEMFCISRIHMLHQWNNMLPNLTRSWRDRAVNDIMYVLKLKKLIMIVFIFFHAKASFDFKLLFRCRGVLIHLSTVLVKILGSIMESLLLHLPYTNVFSTGNHLKLKNLVYLIALSRWLVLQSRWLS